MPNVRTVRQPQYFERFRCLGSDCEDTCCDGWGIVVDRETYEKYQNPLIQRIPGESLSSLVEINPAATSSVNYAKFRLAGTRCPALEGGLCSIQQVLGEPYIADLCSSFPRVLNVTSEAIEKSLHTSCPEAARLILLDPEAMILHESAEEKLPHRSGSLTMIGDASGDYLKEVRRLAIEVIKDRSRPLWQRIVSLGYAIERLSSTGGAARARILEDHLRNLRAGLFDDVLNQQEAAPALQIEMVLELIVARIGTDYTSSRFLECYREFMQGLSWTAESSMDDLAIRYQSACHAYFLPFVRAREHFFENYLANYIFRTYFPWRRKPGQVPAIDGSREAMTDAFLLLAVHYAIIRTVMIGMAALHKDELNVDHALKLVQSYSKAFLHSTSFDDAALEFLKKNPDDPIRKAAVLVMD
jgi:lysine-N-methylase